MKSTVPVRRDSNGCVGGHRVGACSILEPYRRWLAVSRCVVAAWSALASMVFSPGCAATIQATDRTATDAASPDVPNDVATADASSPDVPRDVATTDAGSIDVPTDAAIPCTPDTGCPRGFYCVPPQSCGRPWTCEPVHSCPNFGVVELCACDGTTTFLSSVVCLAQPFLYEGPCQPAAEDGGTPTPLDGGVPIFCGLPSGWYCPSGSTCPRGDNCETCTCDHGIANCSDHTCPARASLPPGTCESNLNCPSGQQCVGSAGCGVPWTCSSTGEQASFEVLVPYCLCTGETVYGSANCPPGRYAHTGACGLL